MAYVLFGLSLTAVFGVIIVFYYSKKRHESVETPKYRMMDDED